jgi:hypothetical protein
MFIFAAENITTKKFEIKVVNYNKWSSMKAELRNNYKYIPDNESYLELIIYRIFERSWNEIKYEGP